MSTAYPRSLRVLEAGPLTTVQDEGRPGRAALGIGRSGACDRGAHRLANALVGNPSSAATLEVTLGGLVVLADHDLLVAVTGARCPGTPHLAPFELPAGQTLTLAPPPAGLRSYVAVRGGIDVEPVLGSRSTDLLSGLGPPVVRSGTALPLGAPTGDPPGVDVAPVPEPTTATMTLPLLPGARRDWFVDGALDSLTGQTWTVDSRSNRIGVRLEGTPLTWRRDGELVSEGLLPGAIQVPPSGQPVLFLADHPVTGGYPVIAYVDDGHLDRAAQLRPGQGLRFRSSGDR